MEKHMQKLQVFNRETGELFTEFKVIEEEGNPTIHVIYTEKAIHRETNMFRLLNQLNRDLKFEYILTDKYTQTTLEL